MWTRRLSPGEAPTPTSSAWLGSRRAGGAIDAHPPSRNATCPHPSYCSPPPSAPVRAAIVQPAAPVPLDPHAVRSRHPLVLGADTVVVVDGRVLGKPADAADARQMLGRLAGRRHEVLTGVALAGAAEPAVAVATTAVWFALDEHRDIAWYIATGEADGQGRRLWRFRGARRASWPGSRARTRTSSGSRSRWCRGVADAAVS